MTSFGSGSLRRWRIAMGLAIAMFAVHPAAAQPFNPKLDRALQGAGDRGRRVRVIARVDASQRSAVKRALASRGHVSKYEHARVSALTLEVPEKELNGLSRMLGVKSVSIDAPVSATQFAVTTSTGDVLRRTLGIPVSSTYQGTGVGVAVIDSGIAPLSTFGSRIRAFYDFTRGGIATAPFDDYGHGTHVASLIAGNGSPYGTSYQGVAPQVSLIGLRVLDGKGRGYTSYVIDAIEFAIANKVALDIDVINLSLGHVPYESAESDPLVQAVENAVSAGIVVVVSAGNLGVNGSTGLPGYGGITSPGNARSAITVGSAHTMASVRRSDDRVGAYSSRGPTWFDGYAKPDLVAPGHKLVQPIGKSSELNNQYPTLRVGTSTPVSQLFSLTGTSMAAAVTSGVVARIIHAAGSNRLTPNTVKAVLQFTATTMHDEGGAVYDHLTQGAGLLNSGGAVTLARAINSSAPRGSYWLTSTVTTTTDFGSEVVPWGENVVWGDNVIWGDSIYRHLRAWDNVIWGDNIVWTTSALDNVIWGENVVWGEAAWTDNIVWGNNVVWGEGLDNVIWGESADDNVIWGESDPNVP